MSSPQQTLEEVKKAIGAHGKWKLNLRTAINTGKSDFSPFDVSCDNKCEFGKWLYGPTITPDLKAGKPYQVVRRLHADFHRSASAILKHALAGNKDTAIQLMDTDYRDKSEILIRALNKWKGELEVAVRGS